MFVVVMFMVFSSLTFGFFDSLGKKFAGDMNQEEIGQMCIAIGEQINKTDILTYNSNIIQGSELLPLLVEAIALEKIIQKDISNISVTINSDGSDIMSLGRLRNQYNDLNKNNLFDVTYVSESEITVDFYVPDIIYRKKLLDNLNNTSNIDNLIEWGINVTRMDGEMLYYYNPIGKAVVSAMVCDIFLTVDENGGLGGDFTSAYTWDLVIDPNNRESATFIYSIGDIAIKYPVKIEYSFGDYKYSVNMDYTKLTFEYNGKNYMLKKFIENILMFKVDFLNMTTDSLATRTTRQVFYLDSENTEYPIIVTEGFKNN